LYYNVQAGTNNYLERGAAMFSGRKLEQENLQLRERIRQLEAERDEAHRVLKMTPDPVSVFDLPSQTGVYASQEITAILGYSTAEIERMGSNLLATLYHPDDIPRIAELMEQIQQTDDSDVLEWEMRARHANGEWRWLRYHTRVYLRAPDGTVQQTITTARDVTRYKQLEAERERNQQRMRELSAIVETTSDAIGLANLAGQTIYHNQAFIDLFGYTPEQLNAIGGPSAIYVDPNIGTQVFAAIQRGEPWQGETALRTREGRIVPVLLRADALYDDQGAITGLVGICTDITERKRNEENLRVFETLVENMVEGVAMNHVDTTFFYCNPAYYAMIGQESLEGKTISDIYADPPETLGAAAQQAITNGSWIGDLSIKRPDGSLLPVNVSVVTLYDDQQQPQKFIAVARDLTEQRQREAQIYLFKTLVEEAPDGFLLVNPADGTFMFANQALEALLKRSIVPGETMFWEMFDPAHHAQIGEVAEAVMQGFWRGILEYRRADGSTFRGAVSAFPITDEADNVVAMTSIVRDNTDQERAEAEREALQQQVIAAQQAALRELSTPLIPIADGVIVMPLIGTIDSQRAEQVMESLLEGVSHHRAHTVILDITGVQVVDTQVANAFIQAAHAVQLLGAQVMLTGIQPQIAQTIVQLGVDLLDIVTESSLQAAVVRVLRDTDTRRRR
jgi:rsbT co-antagonist protein RsbR